MVLDLVGRLAAPFAVATLRRGRPDRPGSAPSPDGRTSGQRSCVARERTAANPASSMRRPAVLTPRAKPRTF